MIDFNSINLKSGLERCKIHEIAIHLHAMYIYMYKLYNDVAQLQVSSASICLAFIMHTLHDFDDFPVLINDSYSMFLFVFVLDKDANGSLLDALCVTKTMT